MESRYAIDARRAESHDGPEPRKRDEAAPAPHRVGRVLALQRSAGNAAVARALDGGRARRVSNAQAAAALEDELASRPGRDSGDVPQFRVPTAEDIKAELKSNKVTPDVIQDRIKTALTRMHQENRLRTTNIPVVVLIKRIFPTPGEFNEEEYAKAVDVTDRSKVYANIADARAKVSDTDRPALVAAMRDAIVLINQAAGDAEGLVQVFGTKSEKAKTVYEAAAKIVAQMAEKIDTMVDTDYNRDDEETGVAGFALFAKQRVHFTSAIAAVTDPKDAKATIIHESTHLADETVKDKGYYGRAGFDKLDDPIKVTNAAHFEELPRRLLGNSLYPGLTFVPLTSEGTKGDTPERQASEYFRKAWDSAVKVHQGLRQIRQQVLDGKRTTFEARKARIKEISEMMDLTFHLQVEGREEVSAVDLVLAEGVAHAIYKAKGVKVDPGSDVVQLFVTKYGPVEGLIRYRLTLAGRVRELSGNYDLDRYLCDWLVANPSPLKA